MSSEYVEITPLQQMTASCSGAIFTSLMVTPLDVVKVRLQKQVKHKHNNGKKASSKFVGVGCADKKLFIPSVKSCFTYCTSKKFISVTPLDVVKVRLQAQRHHLSAGQCFIYCNGLMDHVCTCDPFAANSKEKAWYLRPGKFNGTFDAMVKIARTEGISSLWSGLPPTLVMAVPATVCYFTLYDNLLQSLHSRYERKFWMPMVAGGSARIAAVTLISPLEMIRTKMQSEKLSYLELAKAIKITTAEKGIKSLWTGWGPTLLRDVPFSVLYWLFYEELKYQCLRHRNLEYPTFLLSFSAGAIAGALAAVVTCPFDVIKTHRQVELGELEALKDYKSRPTSTWLLLHRLYNQQGYRALFAGLTPRVIKVAPACAIMIGTYEYLKKVFKEKNKVRLN